MAIDIQGLRMRLTRPLSNRRRAEYIDMINIALDSIPIEQSSDFNTAAAELEKIVNAVEAKNKPRFQTTTKEYFEAIHEFFTHAEDYAKPEYRQEYLEILLNRIRARITEFRTLTAEQQTHYTTDQKNKKEITKQNHHIMASNESKRAEHIKHVESEETMLHRMQEEFNLAPIRATIRAELPEREADAFLTFFSSVPHQAFGVFAEHEWIRRSVILENHARIMHLIVNEHISFAQVAILPTDILKLMFGCQFFETRSYCFILTEPMRSRVAATLIKALQPTSTPYVTLMRWEQAGRLQSALQALWKKGDSSHFSFFCCYSDIQSYPDKIYHGIQNVCANSHCSASERIESVLTLATVFMMDHEYKRHQFAKALKGALHFSSVLSATPPPQALELMASNVHH